jgi:hypothetical protein
MSRARSYYGTIGETEVRALEAAGDVSYRVRVKPYGERGSGSIGSDAYVTTLASARAAVDRLAKKWGPFAAKYNRTAINRCDVLVEARERTYWWDGSVKRGIDAGPWRLLEIHEKILDSKEVTS